MKTVQGKVLRLENKHLVVVTDDGQFLRIAMPKNKPVLGEVIEVSESRPAYYRSFKPFAAVAAVLVIVLAVSMFHFPVSYAAVALDLPDSSIELTLNQKGEIVKATAQNDAGEKMLEGLDLDGLNVYKGVQLITEKAGQIGGFSPDGNNLTLAAVIPLKADAGQKIVDNKKLMNTIHDEMYEGNHDGYVMVSDVNRDAMEEAHNMGLSVNKYLLLQKTKEGNKDASKESIKNNSTTAIMEAYNLDISKMGTDVWCEVNEDHHDSSAPQMNGQTTSGSIDHDSSVQNHTENETDHNSTVQNHTEDGLDPGTPEYMDDYNGGGSYMEDSNHDSENEMHQNGNDD